MESDGWADARGRELEIERRALVEKIQELGGGDLARMEVTAELSGTMARLEVVRGLIAENAGNLDLADKHSRMGQKWAQTACSARKSEADKVLDAMEASLRAEVAQTRLVAL